MWYIIGIYGMVGGITLSGNASAAIRLPFRISSPKSGRIRTTTLTHSSCLDILGIVGVLECQPGNAGRYASKKLVVPTFSAQR